MPIPRRRKTKIRCQGILEDFTSDDIASPHILTAISPVASLLSGSKKSNPLILSIGSLVLIPSSSKTDAIPVKWIHAIPSLHKLSDQIRMIYKRWQASNLKQTISQKDIGFK